MQKKNSEYATSLLLEKEKINYNLKIFRLYPNINSNINHSNMREVNQNLKLFSNSNIGDIIWLSVGYI